MSDYNLSSNYRNSLYAMRTEIAVAKPQALATISGLTDGALMGNSDYRSQRPLTASEWLQREVIMVCNRGRDGY